MPYSKFYLSLALSAAPLSTNAIQVNLNLQPSDGDANGAAEEPSVAVLPSPGSVGAALAVDYDEFPSCSMVHYFSHHSGAYSLSWCSDALLDTGADVNAKNSKGETALHTAVLYFNTDMLQALLRHEAIDVNAKNSLGETALHMCRNNLDAMQALLRHEAIDVNAQTSKGRTPLHYAASHGRADAVRILLEKDGVETGIRDHRGATPLHHAAEFGNEDVVRVLLEQDGVEAGIRDHRGATPLHSAASNGHADVVRALLEQGGVEADIRDHKGATPLEIAEEFKCHPPQLKTELLRRFDWSKQYAEVEAVLRDFSNPSSAQREICSGVQVPDRGCVSGAVAKVRRCGCGVVPLGVAVAAVVLYSLC